jgi:hypothetical protein
VVERHVMTWPELHHEFHQWAGGDIVARVRRGVPDPEYDSGDRLCTSPPLI